MTNMLEYLEKRKKEVLEGKKSEANQVFLDNIGNIETIATTKGYKMIRTYWVNKGNDSLRDLCLIDMNDTANLAKAKAKVELSVEFISFLDAHEKGLT